MPGTIIVKPIQAKLDKDETTLSKFDPYCVAIVGDHHVESEVCKKGGKMPVWSDALALQRDNEPYCYLEVKNKSLIKDKMFGICAIDLDELARQGNTQKWYELYYDKKHAGEILIDARIATDDGYQGGIEGTRVLSPERLINEQYRSFSGSYEGLSTHQSSSKKQEHLVGYSPFQKKIPALEGTMSSIYRDSPIERQYDSTRVYESQSTVKDIMSELNTRDFSSMSYSNNQGYSNSYPGENQVERELSDLQSKVDQILCKSRAMEEERVVKESFIFQTPTVNIQSFQRQDSIPNEGSIKDAVPLMPNPQHIPIHASHDKFGNDANAKSRVVEFKEKLLERVTKSKDMIKERINMMVSKEQEEFRESSQPSLKHKVITGVGKAMAKRQFNSERKVDIRQEETEEISKGNGLKEKMFCGIEQITHSSIKTLTKLEDKMRQKREEEEIQEKKQNGLKERVEYIKDVSREMVLAKLRREGVEEGVQTEERYLDDEPSKMEVIKDKVEHAKEIAKEKVDEITHKKNNKKKVVIVEEDIGIMDKLRGGIVKGAKHVAIKMAKKKMEEAEENNELSHPEKKKKVHRKIIEASGSEKEVLSSEEHIPKSKRAATHKKPHRRVYTEVTNVSDEEEGIIDRIKEGIERGAKHVALKVAINKLEQAEDNLEHPEHEKKQKHKKTVKKYQDTSDEEIEEKPSKVTIIKEKIEDGAEKLKEVVAERKVQTEIKKSRRKTLEPLEQEHQEGDLKRKLMEEIEQIMSFAKEKIAQFGNKETEEHEADQRIYDELTRTAERSLEYDEIRRDQASSLNSELIEGMKDLTATLDRLQQRIESRIGSQYGCDSEIITVEGQEKKKRGIESVKEKFEEGIEQVKILTHQSQRDTAVPSEPIIMLMDNLSKEIQESNIDDKIYMTKEYKEDLEKESQLENEKMETIKLQIREGVEQVKNMVHLDKQEPAAQEGFYYGETDIMIPLHDDAEKPGMVEAIKQKFKEGVEQVKHMTQINQQRTEIPSGPIAGLMDQLSEEMSKPKVESITEFDAEQHSGEGVMETIKQKLKEGKEKAKAFAHKEEDSNQQTQLCSGMGVNLLTGGLPAFEQIPASPGSSIFKFDETKDEGFIRYEKEQKQSGIAGTIKEKIKQGIEQVKSMIGKGEVTEEDNMSVSEIFKSQNELMRSPQVAPMQNELRRSPENSTEIKPADMFESVYITAPKIEENIIDSNMVSSKAYYLSQEPIGFYNSGFEAQQPDVFESVSFGGDSKTNYQFETPVENIMYESQYVKQIKTPFDEDYGMKEVTGSTFEQQLFENKEKEKPANQFSESF